MVPDLVIFLDQPSINYMKVRLCHSFSTLVIFNTNAKMKSFRTSMDRVSMILSSSKNKDKIFQLLPLRWSFNSSIRIKPSSISIERVKIKPFSSKSKDETF